jgi:hypothetical protein
VLNNLSFLDVRRFHQFGYLHRFDVSSVNMKAFCNSSPQPIDSRKRIIWAAVFALFRERNLPTVSALQKVISTVLKFQLSANLPFLALHH